jgi:hypothetical protein
VERVGQDRHTIGIQSAGNFQDGKARIKPKSQREVSLDTVVVRVRMWMGHEAHRIDPAQFTLFRALSEL